MAELNIMEPLDLHIKLLLNSMKPAERKRKMRLIGRALRKANQNRIKKQVNPDGSAFSPRKQSEKKKRPKKMFMALRTAKHMKLFARAKGVSVGFAGRDAKIARIHQFGQRDVISVFGQQYDFPVRELLGFSADDQDIIKEIVLNAGI